MTVVCELHSMLKELKAATERGMTGELYSSVTRPDTTPLPANMFTESLNELEELEGALPRSPKKTGSRTLRGASAAVLLFSPSASKTDLTGNADKSAQGTEKSEQSGGLAGPMAVDAKEGSSAEDSLPPPPPNESGSLSDSSVPPPPPTSGSADSSVESSLLPPVHPEFGDSPSILPVPSHGSRVPSENTASASLEPADAATYVSVPIEKEKMPRPKSTSQTAASARPTTSSASTTAIAVKVAPSSIAPPPQSVPAPTSASKKTAQALTKLVTHELSSSFLKINKDSIDETPPMESSALSKLLGPTDVEVWVPGAKATMTIHMLPSATMQQLVIQTVKNYNAQLGKAPGEKPLDANPDAYNVRVALPDGQPDTLFPVLAKKGTLDQWAEVAFVLLENPNYKPTPVSALADGAGELSGGGGGASDRARSASVSLSGIGFGMSSGMGGAGPGGMNAGGMGGAGGANGGGGAHHGSHHGSTSSAASGGGGGGGPSSGNVSSSNSSVASTSTTSGSGGSGAGSSASGGASGSNPSSTVGEKVVVRVTLPTGAYHTLLAEPSMKLGKLLILLCEKRQLIPSHYALVSMEKEYLSQHMRVQDLKELHMILEAKSSAGPLGPPSAEEMFYNDNVAAQYKLFSNLIFHIKNKKKFGTTSKTETVSLGIDGTKLEIIFTKRGGAPHLYAISDLKIPPQPDDNPFYVTIETIKEKDKLVFEASSAALGLEILTKLTILLEQLGKEGPQQH